MQFLSRWSCNFNIARVNQLRFSYDLSPQFTKHGTFEQQFRYSAGAHVLVWFDLFHFASFCFNPVLFCFVLFYKSAKTSANVNKFKKHGWRGGCCLLLFLVRFFCPCLHSWLYILRATKPPEGSLLIHDCHILIKNRGKIASSFEQVRNSCDIAAIKSRWNRSCFTRAILKLQLRLDKNCIELRTKIACVNGPLINILQILSPKANYATFSNSGLEVEFLAFLKPLYGLLYVFVFFNNWTLFHLRAYRNVLKMKF